MKGTKGGGEKRGSAGSFLSQKLSHIFCDIFCYG